MHGVPASLLRPVRDDADRYDPRVPGTREVQHAHAECLEPASHSRARAAALARPRDATREGAELPARTEPAAARVREDHDHGAGAEGRRTGQAAPPPGVPF